MNFNGKRVLVTGAAGGIGRALVNKFVELGAQVAAADQVVDHSMAQVVLPGDLCDPVYAAGLPRAAWQALGGLDIVINNAGIMRRGSVVESSDEDFDLSVQVNIKAPFLVCRESIPLMDEGGGGVIVNTASCWGVHPGPNHAVYCMTKSAIASLTQCMGRDHAHQNIRINAVCPNEVDTPMLRSGFEKRGFDPQTAVQELGETVPLGRIAEADDIVDVILFLASDQSRYICGSLVEVNGGKSVA